jgi:hypothetical protein
MIAEEEKQYTLPESLLINMTLHLMAYRLTFKPWQIGFQSIDKILDEVEEKTGIKTS